MAETVSSVLLRILKKHGIRHVFGLPAAQIAMVMDGPAGIPGSSTTVCHEEACGHMGHAIAKLTDSMAMCFATVGPARPTWCLGRRAWADNAAAGGDAE
jgi:thiamine pyrophosphate-dependent acetolactate synthase large subunit-like protein